VALRVLSFHAGDRDRELSGEKEDSPLKILLIAVSYFT
jgi:hypothetical protein